MPKQANAKSMRNPFAAFTAMPPVPIQGVEGVFLKPDFVLRDMGIEADGSNIPAGPFELVALLFKHGVLVDADGVAYDAPDDLEAVPSLWVVNIGNGFRNALIFGSAVGAGALLGPKA